jgi:glycosyltransferase involved in cell wall biosynthesis
MKTRRITFPLEGFILSGGIRIVLQLANSLALNGYSVRIVVPDYAASPPFKLLDCIELVVVKTRGPAGIKKFVYRATLCLKAVREADICFATGYKTPYYLCLAKWLSFSRTRLIYLIQHYEPLSHAGLKNGISKLILSCIARLSYRLPLKKIAVSRWIRDKIGDTQIVVIDNGIDLATFCAASCPRAQTETFTVGTIANRTEWKGFPIFLDAVSRIPSQEKRAMRVVVASQTSFDMPNGVSAKIIHPLNDNELATFYRSCDAFVCSSTIEGFGLPALEAMACGATLITTECGGVSQFANPTNCLMVPPGDSKAIADAILELRRNHRLRLALREEALKTSRAFSLEKMISEYINIVSKYN